MARRKRKPQPSPDEIFTRRMLSMNDYHGAGVLEALFGGEVLTGHRRPYATARQQQDQYYHGWADGLALRNGWAPGT